MKREYNMANTKFVLTKNEFGYQEVLDDFENAKTITVVTYNISLKQHHLLNSLRKAGGSADVKIVTNIPNRWDTYYGDRYKELARKNISLYLAKLDPASFGDKYALFFNFSNHGKIVATENVAYIGSSNFSDESKQNMEMGFIIRDAGFIKYLMLELIPEIENQSTPYFEYNYMPLLLQAKMLLTKLYALENEFIDQVYSFHDEHGYEKRIFNDTEERYAQRTLDELMLCCENVLEVADEILDAMTDLIDHDGDEFEEQDTLVVFLRELGESVANQIHSDEIQSLVSFDSSTVSLSILANEYGAVAYDEDLDKYATMSMGQAMDEFHDLCWDAKCDMDNLLDILRTMSEHFRKQVEVFEKLDLQKCNDDVDNTRT